MFDFDYWESHGIRGDVVFQRGPNVKVVCPKCSERKGGTREKDLSVNINTGTWNCHSAKCGWSGGPGREERKSVQYERHDRVKKVEYQKPAELPKKTVGEPTGEPSRLEAFFASRGITIPTYESFGIVDDGKSICFPYYRDGEHINTKHRGPSKRFWMEAGAELILWGVDDIDTSEPVIVVEGECLTGEAEVLTAQGWVRFDQYSGQPVAQVHEGGRITMTDPLAIVRKPYTGDLLRFQNSQRFQTTVTPGHRMISTDNKGRWREWRAEDGVSSGDNIPRVGKLNGPGIPLTDDQIALAIAVSADAAIDNRTRRSRRQPAEDRYVRFGFKKNRKIERLRDLLERLGIEASDNPIADGYQSICFPLPAWAPGRMLPHEWITLATSEQREFILAEIVEWDGNSVPNRNQHEYSSKHLANVEFVQAIAHTSGRVSTIMPRRNEHGEWYKVSILHSKTSTSMQTESMRQPERIAHDGMVYCVTVPTGMFLVREAGCITVTGNCDRLALAEAGIRNVLSVPAGAPPEKSDMSGVELAYLPSGEEIFKNAHEVILAGDMDKPGQALVDEIARRIGRSKCWKVAWPEGCKDANDTLLQHGSLAVRRCIENRTPYPVDGIKTPIDYLEDLRDFESDTSAGLPIKAWPAFSNLIRFSEGQLSIVTGIPGSGKSVWLNSLMMHKSKEHGWKWGVFSPEYHPTKQHVRDLVELYLDKPINKKFSFAATWKEVTEATETINEWFNFILPPRPTLEDVMERAQALVYRSGIKGLVIDPWTELDQSRPTGMSTTDWVDICLKTIRRFGRDYGVHVFVVAHPTKMRKNPNDADKKDPVVTPYDISDSRHWFEMADVILSVWRDKDDTSAPVVVYVQKVRFRDNGQLGEGMFYYNNITRKYTESVQSDTLPMYKNTSFDM